METQATKEQREQFYRDHYVVYTATFVPQSKSRNAKEKTRTINWRVTIGRERFGEIETDYQQGIGHIPLRDSKTLRQTHYDMAERERIASEDGKYYSDKGRWSLKPLP